VEVVFIHGVCPKALVIVRQDPTGAFSYLDRFPGLNSAAFDICVNVGLLEKQAVADFVLGQNSPATHRINLRQAAPKTACGFQRFQQLVHLISSFRRTL
jgi:hypothetical protein